MEINNHTKHNLTNYSINDKKLKAVSSDHCLLIMEFKLKTVSKKKTKIKIPNFDDTESQIRFKYATSDTCLFTDCFKCKSNWLTQFEISNIKT